MLVKTGADVLVSVRRAIGGTDLSQLHDAVKRQFLALDEEERKCSRSSGQDGSRPNQPFAVFST